MSFAQAKKVPLLDLSVPNLPVSEIFVLSVPKADSDRLEHQSLQKNSINLQGIR
jgi:hypothetical protein